MTKENSGVRDELTNISTEDVIDKFQCIKLLHYRLMVVYVYAIEHLQAKDRIPRGVEPSGRERRRMGITRLLVRGSSPYIASKLSTNYLRKPHRSMRHGPITRALVESHIKGQLGQLRTAYVQIEQSVLETASTLTFRAWLRDSQDSLARFSGTLSFTNFARRIIAALWPLVIALAAVGTVWDTIFRVFDKEKSQPGVLVTLGALALIVVTYLVFGLSIAATRKRGFFLARISLSSVWAINDRATTAGNVTANNIYEMENELFDAINKPKRAELPLDMYLIAANLLLWAILETIVGFSYSHTLGGRLFFIAAFILFMFWAFAAVVIGVRRKLR